MTFVALGASLAGAMNGDARDRDSDRQVCSPCRGSGKVISNLGGEPHDVICPWCGGTGRFAAGRDAQQSSAEQAQS
jgi:DnaJ-class molecular chaperone